MVIYRNRLLHFKYNFSRYFYKSSSQMSKEEAKGVKRSPSPAEINPLLTPKLRDSLGFRMKRQTIDKRTLTAYQQLGGEESNDDTNTLSKTKTFH